MSVSAQAWSDVLPLEPGNRWVYDLEGVTPLDPSRTIVDVDARSTWTVLEVRSSADADTVALEVDQVASTGNRDTAECTFVRGRSDGGALYLVTRLSTSPLCRLSGGLPFSPVFAGLLNGYDALGTRTVEVGSRTYDRNVVERSFRYNESCQPATCGSYQYEGVDVRATLAEGIGQVSMEAAYTLRRECSLADSGGYVCSTDRRDTLRVKLVGAEVGGEFFGDIGPVSVSPHPLPLRPTLRVGPNPLRSVGTAWVTLSGARDANLSVLDALGRVVRSVSVAGDGAVAFDVTGLTPGVYVVTLTSGADRVVSPIVIAR